MSSDLDLDLDKDIACLIHKGLGHLWVQLHKPLRGLYGAKVGNVCGIIRLLIPINARMVVWVWIHLGVDPSRIYRRRVVQV